MTQYVDHCSDHMADDDADPEDLHKLGWCRECHREVFLSAHNVRLLPTDLAKTHAVRDEWRTECSCGWAGPPDAGQVLAADHWLAHMRERGA